jgi:hypothetical protein
MSKANLRNLTSGEILEQVLQARHRRTSQASLTQSPHTHHLCNCKRQARRLLWAAAVGRDRPIPPNSNIEDDDNDPG